MKWWKEWFKVSIYLSSPLALHRRCPLRRLGLLKSRLRSIARSPCTNPLRTRSRSPCASRSQSCRTRARRLSKIRIQLWSERPPHRRREVTARTSRWWCRQGIILTRRSWRINQNRWLHCRWSSWFQRCRSQDTSRSSSTNCPQGRRSSRPPCASILSPRSLPSLSDDITHSARLQLFFCYVIKKEEEKKMKKISNCSTSTYKATTHDDQY